MIGRRAFLIFFLCLWPMLVAADELVPAGSTWRYLDNGTNQGTAWRALAFNDASWQTGAAELGYGDGDEETTVSYGPNANNKYVTTYFRKTFNVADPNAYVNLVLSTLRDDGAVVYLNGVEVWRSENMPGGAIGYQTYALWALGTPEEATFYDTQLASSLLVAGQNVLAVEIHQADPASTDISFDLRLEGLTNFVVTRGPYLQLGTPTSMVVRWRTNGATDSRVRYGTTPGNLNVIVDDATLTTEHQIALTGLTPSTTYYYSVGTSAETLAGDATHTFTTAPPISTSIPTRIWVLGDSGAANTFAMEVRDAYLSFPGSSNTNLWLMLGDNAYEDGTDEEYQAAVFDMYPTMLRRSVLWPTIGNHDTAQLTTAPPTLPYFQMFTLPTAGEAGGVASGTEKYYSFDYANIHFICLDSMTSDRTTTGPMLTWLETDLAATSQQWIIAFWHHPPYSKGSHDSDFEDELAEMRTNAVPILEEYGVDLVLSGHSHSYERSFLIDSHYGTSGTFISSMKKDGGSGRPEETGAYNKPTSGMAPHEGAVYAVAGSGSIISGGALNHPAMFISLNQYGSMVLDVNGGRLDAKFLRENGFPADSFTIIKGPPATAPSAPSALSATAVSTTAINLSWTDNATNEDHFSIERCLGTTCSEIAQPAANATSYSDSGLTPNTTYSYRIRAENAHGDSAYSNTATATTHACVYNVTPTSFDFPAAGGTGEVTITTGAGCAWAPIASDAWITLTNGTSGSGNGETTFTVAANNGAERNGSITIAGHVIPITQDAAACSYNVTPTSFTIPASGGSRNVTITTSAWCAWTSAENVSWIALTSGTSGTGSGTTTFSVDTNSGAQRNATITVAGTTINITQEAAACSYDVTPTSFTVPASGGSRNVTITTGAWCAWTSTENVPWIALTSGMSGTGSGTTTFSVDANTGAQRNATIAVAGTTINITQEAAACSYGVTPTAFTIPASGGSRDVTITTGAWCAWTSTENVAWIALTSGTSGTGSGTTTFSVDVNTGAQRNATITVAGTTINITQEAAGCSYDVTPTAFTVPASGGTREVTITTSAWCAWESSSNVSWITLTGGLSGTGSGATTFTIDVNSGAQREATITVAGVVIPITQEAAACSYDVTPTSFTIAADGGSREVTVTTSSWCTWQSSTTDAWITIDSGASGTGSGTATFTVAPNFDAERSGSLTVAGTVITIVQQAPPPPPTPTGVNAQAISNNAIRVTWSPVASASSYEILRASSGSPLAPIGTSATALFDDISVTPGAAYRYAVRAVNGSGASGISASDIAVARAFTDGALPAGTRVKAAHINERRAAVNAMRALAGLSPFAFSNSTFIRASHIIELRTALDQALAILGYPTGGYTGTPSAGTPIQAVHFREISNRVQ